MCDRRQAALQQEACAALTALLRETHAPLVVVVGNTLSPLAWLYQHLHIVCDALAASGCVRLVSHDLAAKGRLYCEQHLAYTEFTDDHLRCTDWEDVTWVVPRLIRCDWADCLSQIVEQWAPTLPHQCGHVRFVCFMNTDLCAPDDLTGWLPDVPLTSSSIIGTAVSHHHLAVQQSPFRSVLPVLRAHRAMRRSGLPEEVTSLCALSLTGPALLCDSVRLAHLADAKRLQSQTTDFFAFHTRLPSRATWSGNPPPGVALDSASASPVALPNRDAVRHQEAAWQRRHVARSLAHVASSLATARVHSYYPTVTRVGRLLREQVCLSPLFVMKYDGETAAKVPWFRQSEQQWACAQRLHAIVSDGLPAPDAAEHAVRVLADALRTVVPERYVAAWSVTDPLELRALRCTWCLSYEVFPWCPFLFCSPTSHSATETTVANSDAPTMQQSLQRALDFAHAVGWRLVHQVYHDAWCLEPSAPTLAAAQAPTRPVDVAARVQQILASQRGLTPATLAAYSQSASITAAEARAVRWRSSSQHARHANQVGETPGSCSHPEVETKEEENAVAVAVAAKARPVATALSAATVMPDGYPRTHPAVWQSVLVSGVGEGLHLWRGAVVWLPDGQRGTVVGFSRLADALTGHAHQTFPPGHDHGTLFTKAVQSLALLTPDGAPMWSPALPPYLYEMETELFPVVELCLSAKNNKTRRVLITATETVETRVSYPTTCFVSAREQRDHTARCCGPVRMDDPDADTEQSGSFTDVEWRLPRSANDDVVTVAKLPLRLAHFHDAASIFMAVVLNHGLFQNAPQDGPPNVREPPPRLSFSSPSRRPWSHNLRHERIAAAVDHVVPTRNVHAQSEWVELHRERLASFGSSRSQLPSSQLLNARWLVPTRAFVGCPLQFRCVLACLCAANEWRRL